MAEIQDAHRLLEPILGVAIAPIAFAVALLASGQSSTITGTLAGQTVMEGYLNLRIRPWLRRLLTRLMAVFPTLVAISYLGEQSTGRLLVFSQVLLSLQLPFAIIPLIHFVSDKRRMGRFAAGGWTTTGAWLIALVIVLLNLALVVNESRAWLALPGATGRLATLTLLAIAVLLASLLAYITFKPWLDRILGRVRTLRAVGIHAPPAGAAAEILSPEGYHCIAIALDFSGGEEQLLAEAIRIAGSSRPRMVLLHVVESPVARALGTDAGGHEAEADRQRLEALSELLGAQGFEVEWQMEAGDAVEGLARLVEAAGAELVILGGHGHRGLSDLIYGTTAEGLRHRIRASLLVVPLAN